MSHVLWSGLCTCKNAPFSNFQGLCVPVWSGRGRAILLTQGFLFVFCKVWSSPLLWSQKANCSGRDGAACTRLSQPPPPPFVLLVRALLEAAGAAHPAVRVQLRGHGVGDHASQDVLLRGHHVLDEKVSSVVDVEVVLKGETFQLGAGRRTRGGCSPASAGHMSTFFTTRFAFSYASSSRLRLVTFHLQNVEFGCNMKPHTSAPVTHGCQQRVCEHLQRKASKMCSNWCTECKNTQPDCFIKWAGTPTFPQGCGIYGTFFSPYWLKRPEWAMVSGEWRCQLTHCSWDSFILTPSLKTDGTSGEITLFMCKLTAGNCIS